MTTRSSAPRRPRGAPWSAARLIGLFAALAISTGTRAWATPSAAVQLEQAHARYDGGLLAEARALLDELLGRGEKLDELEAARLLGPALLLEALLRVAERDRPGAFRAFSQLLAVEPGWRPAGSPWAVPAPAGALFDEVLEQSYTHAPVYIRPSRGENPDQIAVALYDPQQAVGALWLRARQRGQRGYATAAFRPAAPFSRLHFATLPDVGQRPAGLFVLEYMVEAIAAAPRILDRQERGQVLGRLGDPDRPLALVRLAQDPVAARRGGRLVETVPWYRRRWVWLVAGVAITGGIIAAAARSLRDSERLERSSRTALVSW